MQIISRYTILFEEKGQYYLFNSQSRFFSRISEKLFSALNSGRIDELPNQVVEKLRENKVVIDASEEDSYYYDTLSSYMRHNYDPNYLTLVLVPTTGCNLACPYCFEPKKNPKVMTEEVIEALAKYIKRCETCKGIHLTWYGGEPLLGYSVIQRLYEMFGREGMPPLLSQTMITNGVLLSDEKILYLKEKGMASFQITLDGVKDRHDTLRIGKAGAFPTYDAIWSNLERLQRLFPEARVSIRVNIDKDNWKDFIAVSKNLKEAFPDSNIVPYPGYLRIESDDKKNFCHPSIKVDEIMGISRAARGEGIQVPMFPTRKSRGCMLQSDNAIIVGPEGEVYKCWNDVSNPERVVGYIAERPEVKVNRRLMHRYLHECHSYNDECKECGVFPLCEGGCGHNRYRNRFEDGDFEVCCPYKDPQSLKEALLYGEIEVN